MSERDRVGFQIVKWRFTSLAHSSNPYVGAWVENWGLEGGLASGVGIIHLFSFFV
jgi:hypothetical protein